MILDSTNLLFNNFMILWPHSAQKYCCLGACRGKSTFKRGNSAPWTRGILLEIKRLCELSTSVSFLIDQERLRCYGNQQPQRLKTQKFTSCSESIIAGLLVPDALQAAVLHLLAGHSWLLQCNSISISTCASMTAKGKGRAQGTPGS